MSRPVIFAKLADHGLNEKPPAERSYGDGVLVAIELPDNWAIVGEATTVSRVLDAVVAWRENPSDILTAQLEILADLLITERAS